MTAPGALDGVRVLDLAGPFAAFGARMLADLGADVVRIEPPGGDALRRRGPFARNRPTTESSLPSFLVNCNKRGITLDLETEAGRRLFTRLAGSADVVIETASPGQMAGCGIGYADIAAANERLVWVAVTPFGQDGPWAGYHVGDLGAQAIGGALYLTGEPGERPVRAGGRVAEKMAGYMAAFAAILALRWRDQGNGGQFIDLSVQEAVVAQMESFTTKIFYTGAVYSRDGRLYPRTYPGGVFPCRDGWVSLVAGPRHQWQALRGWVGDQRLFDPAFDELDARMQARPYLDDILCAWTSQHEKAYLFHEGQRRKIPVGISLQPGEVARDQHLRERGYLSRAVHAELGDVEVPGRPYVLEKTPWVLRRPAPLLGEHNQEVYGELGLPPDGLAELRRLGVI